MFYFFPGRGLEVVNGGHGQPEMTNLTKEDNSGWTPGDSWSCPCCQVWVTEKFGSVRAAFEARGTVGGDSRDTFEEERKLDVLQISRCPADVLLNQFWE